MGATEKIAIALACVIILRMTIVFLIRIAVAFAAPFLRIATWLLGAVLAASVARDAGFALPSPQSLNGWLADMPSFLGWLGSLPCAAGVFCGHPGMMAGPGGG